MNKNKLKSIGSVLAGFITVFVLSSLTDFVLESIGILPSFQEQQSHGLYNNWLLLLALIYRSIYTILGGFITAKLAPIQPMKHVMALLIVGLVAGIVGLVATWGKGLGPEWYPIALTIISPFCVWLGGKLKIKNKGGDIN